MLRTGDSPNGLGIKCFLERKYGKRETHMDLLVKKDTIPAIFIYWFEFARSEEGFFLRYFL